MGLWLSNLVKLAFETRNGWSERCGCASTDPRDTAHGWRMLAAGCFACRRQVIAYRSERLACSPPAQAVGRFAVVSCEDFLCVIKTAFGRARRSGCGRPGDRPRLRATGIEDLPAFGPRTGRSALRSRRCRRIALASRPRLGHKEAAMRALPGQLCDVAPRVRGADGGRREHC